ncbi:hypothetical protein WQO_34200 (plasmid) [Streptomyces globisporus C-1027]|uniref:Uncharacterized protein n=1 Tax=Streptomyces globisporus C-1027 TaxID=1172567 RepID=A0A0U3KRP1_STRGL|nr:hypothetical protein [Streptomyces globisporus]ALU98494.1 hypothetical protein WQO_34200 [Streptomyces globisporus C-1027]
MSRPTGSPHPRPLTPAGLPARDERAHGCADFHLLVPGGTAGLTAYRRTSAGDPRRQINIPL